MDESEEKLMEALSLLKRALRLLLHASWTETALVMIKGMEATPGRDLADHILILSEGFRNQAKLFPEDAERWLLGSRHLKYVAEVMEGMGEKFPHSETFDELREKRSRENEN